MKKTNFDREEILVNMNLMSFFLREWGGGGGWLLDFPYVHSLLDMIRVKSLILTALTFTVQCSVQGL